MQKLIEKIKFWYKNSRPYTVPITALCWLVVFVWAIKLNSNADPFLGILTYIGVATLHLATNLSDDYFDFIRLNKNGEFTNNEKTIKCKYLRNGSATIEQLRNVIIIMIIMAALIGGYLFFKSGYGVILFAILALPIVIFYSKLSSKGLGDIAVILAYGPLMFGGVYYVMTSKFDFNIILLSLACAIFVEAILYAHMLMDFDSDKTSGKTTLCTRLKNKTNALIGLIILYASGYLLIFTLTLKTSNSLFLITLCTVPLVIDLCKSLYLFNKNPKSVPEIHFWHQPLENWNNIKDSDSAPFFSRFLYVRNISTYFMILTCVAIIFGM